MPLRPHLFTRRSFGGARPETGGRDKELTIMKHCWSECVYNPTSRSFRDGCSKSLASQAA